MSEETKVTETQQEEVKPERKKPGPKPKAAQTKPKEVEKAADSSNESEKDKKDESVDASEEVMDETKPSESDKEDESKLEVTSTETEVTAESKVAESEGQPPISIGEDKPFQSRNFTALNAPMYRASNGKGFIGYVNSGTALSDSNYLGFVKVRASVIGSGMFVGYVKHTQIRLQ